MVEKDEISHPMNTALQFQIFLSVEFSAQMESPQKSKLNQLVDQNQSASVYRHQQIERRLGADENHFRVMSKELGHFLETIVDDFDYDYLGSHSEKQVIPHRLHTSRLDLKLSFDLFPFV